MLKAATGGMHNLNAAQSRRFYQDTACFRRNSLVEAPLSRTAKKELPKETSMRPATNETLITAVRGGVIAGMDTSVFFGLPNGQFEFGHAA
ncbi:MAG: hypothetical protein K2Y42_11540 [Hyphomicrobium sp.]|uniref:hypothetical protein n=1 Tax=Hyphomicrobium sp. TaxID=82 RepID=UPI0025BB885A|nr:hypothetical protein [Hyphomicrobium sp.]MBX9863374.1 hypothetical protein [Hyphomicrobium sp.]